MTGQQLLEAARDGHAATVGTLLSTQVAKSFINIHDANGTTPLHCAAFSGHEAVTEKLLAARCNVDLQDARYGYTALHAAAFSGHAPATTQLLAARCNVDLRIRPYCDSSC
jgi:ankyrin repeat protein